MILLFAIQKKIKVFKMKIAYLTNLMSKMKCKFKMQQKQLWRNLKELKFVKFSRDNSCLIINLQGLITSSDFQKVFQINVFDTFLVSKYVAEQMSKQDLFDGERGVLIHVACFVGKKVKKAKFCMVAARVQYRA